jgi:hypothetical protein
MMSPLSPGWLAGSPGWLLDLILHVSISWDEFEAVEMLARRPQQEASARPVVLRRHVRQPSATKRVPRRGPVQLRMRHGRSAGASTVTVLAHQGGWDEILMVLTLIAVFALLLKLANSRANKAGAAAERWPRRRRQQQRGRR